MLRLVETADGLIEGFRPGVMERLGLGPGDCMARNEKLVFGRMTGFGQDGPLASAAGHDINYIALSGALHAIGPAGGRPVPPLNLVGDFGGGGMLLAFGLVSALLNVKNGGRGQVVDAAMVEGAAALTSTIFGLFAKGDWSDERGRNMLDGGAPWYDTYATSDGRYVAVGAIEARFYAALLAGLGLAGEELPAQHDREGWPRLRARFTEVFASRTRDEWESVFVGSDACVTPVLSLAEVASHAHNAARGTFIAQAGFHQPGPVPRFSGTPAVAGQPAAGPAAGGHKALQDWGLSTHEIAAFQAAGCLAD